MKLDNHMFTTRRTLVLLIASVLLLVVSASSQIPNTSAISVYATDRLGRALSGVEVALTEASTRERQVLPRGSTEGLYSGNISTGDYLLEVKARGFVTESRQVSLYIPTQFFAFGLASSSFGTPPTAITVTGKVTFRGQEPQPRWVRIASVFGSELREAPVREDGNYRMEGLQGEGPYLVWVVAAEKLCGPRKLDYKRFSRLVTLDLKFDSPCTMQK